jgi:hypothetical protein
MADATYTLSVKTDSGNRIDVSREDAPDLYAAFEAWRAAPERSGREHGAWEDVLEAALLYVESPDDTVEEVDPHYADEEPVPVNERPIQAAAPARFIAFEIRPCVGTSDFHGGTDVQSFLTLAEAEEQAAEGDGSFFWTLYGVNPDGTSEAITDTQTETHAFALLAKLTGIQGESGTVRYSCSPAPESFDAIADELTHRCFPAESQQTGGNVCCILVESASGAVYLFGTADTTWAADVYANRDAYDGGVYLGQSISTELRSDIVAPPTVAAAIIQAIQAAETTR